MSDFLKPRIEARLDGMVARRDELIARLATPEAAAKPQELSALHRELGTLHSLSELYENYRSQRDQVREHETLLEPGGDRELADLARAELPELIEQTRALADELLDKMLAETGDGNRNAMVEVRAGTGGEEAALFAGDLCGLYTKFAERKKWKVEVMSSSPTDMGGFKDVVLRIQGPNAFHWLQFESGGHRVQRVPATESQGRIHTSAATVAVLAEVEDLEVVIDEKDLRIDTYRASGAGGQHVNKTDSAVRITHEPTGIVVAMQDERSQIKNRAKAMKVLRSRIYEETKRRQDAERAAERKEQVGSGDRSMRVRTYNFPQDRLTDHRIGRNFPLAQVMEGRLDPVLETLLAEDRERRLAQME